MIKEKNNENKNIKLYQDDLIDHYKFSEYRKKLTAPDFCSDDLNPSCGDRIKIEGKIKGEVNKCIIADLGFDAQGCILSQACTSILLDECRGKKLNDILSLNKKEILDKIGIALGPNRVKCALLSYHVLRKGIEDLVKK